MEVSEYLVGSLAFKAGGTGDPRTAGSIPVHLRYLIPLAFIALLLWIPPAGATARVLSSTPGDGASVQSLDEVVFEFDSLLVGEGAEITVTKLDGTEAAVDTRVERELLIGVVSDELSSGNYEIGYRVRSADGSLNTGSIRVGVDAPNQALSGGLLAVIGIAVGLCIYLAFVFRADQRRRPKRGTR